MSDIEQQNINNNVQQESAELHSSSEFDSQINAQSSEEDANNDNSDNNLLAVISDNIQDDTNEQQAESELQQMQESEDDLTRLHRLLDFEPQIDVENKINLESYVTQNDEKLPAKYSELPQANNKETVNEIVGDIITEFEQLKAREEVVNENVQQEEATVEPPTESEQPQVNENLVNENADNESLVDESSVNEISVNENAVNENLVDESSVNENADGMKLPPPPPEDFFTEAENKLFMPVGGIQLIPGEMPKLRKVERKEEQERDSDSEKPVDFAAFKEKLNNILIAQINDNGNRRPPKPSRQLPQTSDIDHKEMNENYAIDPRTEFEQQSNSNSVPQEFADVPPPPPPPPPEYFLTEAADRPFVPFGGIQLIPGEMPKLRKVERKEEQEPDSDSEKPVDFAAFKEKLNNILIAQMNGNGNQATPKQLKQLIQANKEEMFYQKVAREEAALRKDLESELPHVNEVVNDNLHHHEIIVETEEVQPDQPIPLEEKKFDSFQNALVEKLKERKEFFDNNTIPIEKIQQKKSIELQRLEAQINRLTKTKSDNIFSSNGAM